MEIVFTDVSAGYGHGEPYALQHLSFRIAPGRRLAVLGENGAGKTTLLRVLTGTLPYEGSILADGFELRDMKREERSLRFAMLSQLHGSFYAFTVRETVTHGRYLHWRKNGLFSTPADKDLALVEQTLAQMGLLALADRRIDTLSGGQLQRVFLARAFVQETPVILLDEPSNHLDLRYRQELMDYLLAWSGKGTMLPAKSTQPSPDGASAHGNDAEAHPRTLIGVFHDLHFATRLAEDVLLLKEGRLLAFGAAGDIFGDDALLREAFGMDVRAYYAGASMRLPRPEVM